MKENIIWNIIHNTISLFKQGIYILTFFISLGIFLLLYSFFYGLITIPLPSGVIGFYRMVPPTTFEMFYMIFSATVSALIVMLTIYSFRLKLKEKTKGKSMSAAGLATGVFGAVCPACLGINFLAFGNVFTVQLSFLIPYIFWIQVGGIVLLTVGLYFVAKSAYEKKCISCKVENPTNVTSLPESEVTKSTNKGFIVILVLIALVLGYQVVSAVGQNNALNIALASKELVAKDGTKVSLKQVIEQVTPKAGFETKVKWNGIVSKMVKEGVLDPVKLENILTKRYGLQMKPEWIAILNGKNENLTISNDNAVFMMYILWTFAKHNQNQILTDSPFVKYFKNYDIGVGRAGYGDLPLLPLTKTQQAIATKVAENANRPCCNNSTAAPDCSHGYSALGLVELMASQGFSEKEIFKTFVQFNSYWFPETYVKDALYFKLVNGQDWKDVDKSIIAGRQYSSLSGSYRVKNYLKTNFGI